jgi:hypothetical protein
MSSQWFQQIPGLRAVASRRDRRRTAKSELARRSRLSVESLEDRWVPAATIWWDGGAGTTDWSHAANWNSATGDRLPAASDEVEIGTSFAAATITSTSNVSIRSLMSQASLIVIGGELLTATD